MGECREKRVGDNKLECLDIFISYFELQLHLLFDSDYRSVSFNILETQGKTSICCFGRLKPLSQNKGGNVVINNIEEKRKKKYKAL